MQVSFLKTALSKVASGYTVRQGGSDTTVVNLLGLSSSCLMYSQTLTQRHSFPKHIFHSIHKVLLFIQGM